jgi:YD repeat-containing protein
LTLETRLDSLLRRDRLWLEQGANTATAVNISYGYDAASRLTNVTDNVYNAGYAYLANSPLVGQITFRHSTNVMITTRQDDWVNRLRQTISSPTGPNQLPWVHGYDLNAADQRTRMTLGDGSYRVYEYDTLGQVKSGKRYWSDGTPVAGQQFEYAFDDIGNRNSTNACASVQESV